MTKSISSLIVLLILASCVKDAVVDSSQDYFPLQVGNFWELSIVGTRTIDQTVTLDGKDYYRMVSVRVWPNGTTSKDTAFYRKSSDGKVYQRGTKSTDEILKFDLTAVVGQPWSYAKDPTRSFNPHPWNVTLNSNIDTTVVKNYTIENCYRYYFDLLQMADDEYNVWLAPGIGIVRERYSGGTPDRIAIKRARINGIERVF